MRKRGASVKAIACRQSGFIKWKTSSSDYQFLRLLLRLHISLAQRRPIHPPSTEHARRASTGLAGVVFEMGNAITASKLFNASSDSLPPFESAWMTQRPTLALQVQTLANHCPVAQLVAQHVDMHRHQSEHGRGPVLWSYVT